MRILFPFVGMLLKEGLFESTSTVTRGLLVTVLRNAEVNESESSWMN